MAQPPIPGAVAGGIVFVKVDPAGTCTNPNSPMQYNYVNGREWGCQAGTWTQVSGGGGGGATIAHTLNVIKGDNAGNGLDAGFAATAPGIVSLFSTCSGTQYLGADGACHTAGTGTLTTFSGSGPSWITWTVSNPTTTPAASLAPTTGQSSHQVIGTCNAATTFAPCGLVLGDLPSGLGLTASPLSQFAATTSAQLAGVISDETGSGAAVFATSPTLVTPILGTPTSGTLTNTTGFPAANLAGLGTGVATALAANVSGSGAICLASGSACSGGGGSTGVIGTASFDGAGGISNLVVTGVVSNVTRASAGIYNLTFTTNQSNYTVSILANSNLATPFTTYMNTTDTSPPAAGFQFATVSALSVTAVDSVLVMVTISKL